MLKLDNVARLQRKVNFRYECVLPRGLPSVLGSRLTVAQSKGNVDTYR